MEKSVTINLSPNKKNLEKTKVERFHSSYQEDVVKEDPYLETNITQSMKGDPKRFYCKICGNLNEKIFKEPYWDYITDHISSAHHILLCKDEEGRLKAIEFLKGRSKKRKVIKNKTDKDRIQRELRMDIVGFILQNAMPYRFVDELISFCKYLSSKYDKYDIDNLSLSKTTATKISRECIAASLKHSIINDLKATPYSLSVDESSDVFGDSYLALTAKYLKNNSFQTKLVAVIELQEDKTGLALYELVKKELFSNEDADVLMNNCMGICSDQGSNIHSTKEKGLCNRLRKDIPHLYLAFDFSHKYNLIAKVASKEFPDDRIKMIKNIAKHFSYSSQRLCLLKLCQTRKGVSQNNVKGMIRYVDTRWFSIVHVARRIIQLWEFLKMYFTEEEHEEKLFFIEENYLYIKVFIILMGYLEDYNELFQGEEKTYIDIAPKLRESFVRFSRLICKEHNPSAAFEQFYEIDYLKETCDLNEFQKRLIEDNPLLLDGLSLSNNLQKDVFQAAKNFVIKSLKEMKTRIPFGDDLIKHSRVLQLEDLGSSIWNNWAKKYNNIICAEILDKFHRESSNLKDFFKPEGKFYWVIESCRANCLLLWNHFVMQEEFPYISKLARALLVLPYSSASVERAFSDFKTIKTNKRNLLCRETLETCLLIYQASKKETLHITEDMIQRYATMWHPNKKKDNISPSSSEFNNQEENSDIINNSSINATEPSNEKIFKSLSSSPNLDCSPLEEQNLTRQKSL